MAMSRLLLPLLLCVSSAYGAGVASFSPQGEVRSPQQVRISFSSPMVALGNAAAPAPLSWDCALKGRGHWVDDKSWVLDISDTLPARSQCRFSLRAGLKDVAGTALAAASYAFNTGEPVVEQSWPDEGALIEEDQVFVLRYNGALTRWPALACQSSALAERLPVRPLPPAERAVLLKQLKLEKDAASVAMLRCGQRLAPDSKLSVLSPRAGSTTQRLDYHVRPAFTASLSCQRENAKGACIPFRALSVRFSSPVPEALAAAIRLSGDGVERKPQLGNRHGAPLDEISFPPPFPPLSEFRLTLPPAMVDEVGRKLVNSARFPLPVRFADYPPLAKFAAAPFGIIEANADATLPLTLRGVEAQLPLQSVQLGTQSLRLNDDQQIMRWLGKVLRYHESEIAQPHGKPVASRRLSLLKREVSARSIRLPLSPDAKGKWPFEVVGIPLGTPGLHVLEVESRILGKALLAENKPMYVRTAALVTNLSVHLKQSPENAAVWVSSLDLGKPVPDAVISVYDCRRQLLWQGKTDRQGQAAIAKRLDAGSCDDAEALDGLFVTARKRDSQGRDDVGFVRSGWNRGIEAWRFPFPTNSEGSPAIIAHSVLDRTLLRAGETVSMKHLLRLQNRNGLAMLKPSQLPQEVRIVHDGSGDEYAQPLQWRQGRYAETTFALPRDAKLGEYSIYLRRKATRGAADQALPASPELDGYNLHSGSFRVEAFRLPLMRGVIASKAGAGIAARSVPLSVSLSWGNGGPAKGWPLEISAMLEENYDTPSGHDGFSFRPPERDDDKPNALAGKVLLDKAALKLDGDGNGHSVVNNIPLLDRRYDLVTEAAYHDPNGEVQTLSRRIALWPSALQVGISVDSWVNSGRQLTLKAVVLDTAGKPVANQLVRVRQVAQRYLSTRKRLLGGFYAWEHERQREDQGEVCSGRSDARGLLLCEVQLKQEGSLSLEASVSDSAGHAVTAAQEVWVSGHDELWFDADNNDRIDILPEQTRYRAGDTARFQVRMPFRQATAWVAVERDGIVSTRVLQLSGKNPVIELKVLPEWGPNVYVSVLAVRGRLRDVPWYSFFSWGWKTPLQWWDAFWNEGRDYVAPTALIDLAKPAFKYGIAEISVDDAARRLQVTVTPQQRRYGIRDTAQVTVKVKLPDGKPAPAGTELAFAAVDEALLALQPNNSWQLLEAMYQRHSYNVETATAQLEVVGKRHYGRKALPAGGGGGRAPTRELLDTLLSWQPHVVLGQGGVAQITLPLNDALTRFRLVAVADVGSNLFGSGSATIDVTQALQLSAGLPPLVREGDRLQAGVTVRNGSDKPQTLQLRASAAGLPPLPVQTLKLAAGDAKLVSWDVTIPQDISALNWRFDAEDSAGGARDSLRFAQQVLPAVPVGVTQSTLQRLAPGVTVPLARPADALPGRGGVRVSLQARLGGGLPAVRRWFERYPYQCFEQRTSVALGLADGARWQALMAEMPLYQDKDGLLAYFPLGSDSTAQGSDVLSSYVLAVAQQAGQALPEPGRGRLLDGLAAFVEGRLRRDLPMASQDADARRLAAMDALSRHGRFRPAMLDVLTLTPQTWSSAMLIDWLSLLSRETAIPARGQRLAEAGQLLRARLSYQGTRLVFSSEQQDQAWWLMGSPDVNAARLLLAAATLPAWQADMPRLLTGLLARQQRGNWQTTTANAWGSLAVAQFSRQFERDTVSGDTRLSLGGQRLNSGWQNERALNNWPLLPWPAAPASLQLQHQGSGAPWATIQTEAAIRLAAPRAAGYQLRKQISAVSQHTAGRYQVGDVLQVTLDIDAQADMGWVVLDDPLPAGASLLGSGLGRDSAIAAAGSDNGGASYIERRADSYRAYFAYLPRGKRQLSYRMRLNTVGQFQLPPSRVEAMYAPAVYGLLPNAALTIVAAP